MRVGIASPPKNSTSGHPKLISVQAQKDPYFCLITIAILDSADKNGNLPFSVLDSVSFSISIEDTYVS